MRIIFQLLFVLFSAGAVSLVYRRQKEGVLGKKGAFFWAFFWVLAAVAVIWPSSTQILADLLGIGRGTDLVLYLSVAVIFYLLFKLNVKLDGLNKELTKVVRHQALDKKNEKENI